MSTRAVSCWLFCVGGLLFASCGDDAQITGLGSDDVPSDSAIAVDTALELDTPSDATTDAAVADVPKALSNACQSCENTADCAENLDCIALLNGSFCAPKCTTAADCSAKFTCDKADVKDAAPHCLPPNYSCEGCLATGCPSDQVCQPVTGKCVTGKAPCTPCKTATECGPGLKCAALASPDFSTQTICMPECGPDGSCPAGAVCQKTDGGNVCGFTGLACCYGNCKPDAGCAKCPDKCILGSCVACLVDSNCPGGHCDTTTHTCVNTIGCPPDAPLKLSDGTCGECVVNTDCKAGKMCDVSVHKCIPIPYDCQVCVAPYPDCFQVNGNWSCVECTSDATCAAQKKGTCNPKTFSCSSGTPTVDPGVPCTKDSDCKNFGGTAFDLTCDATATGLCYDKSLKCDNIAAFCNAPSGCLCLPDSPTATVGSCSCGF